jgi:hypothetical protein
MASVDLLGLIDPKITIGNLIEVVAILGGGFVVLLTMRSDIGGLKKSDEERGKQFEGIQNEIKKIAELLTRQAVLDTRMAAAEQDIRDMQRGRGFIQGERGIDHEYTRP